MNRDDPPATADASGADTKLTGLPWPRSWRGVYFLVLAGFCFWLGALIVLTMMYS